MTQLLSLTADDATVVYCALCDEVAHSEARVFLCGSVARFGHAAIQGEGKLEMEGVRPQRYATAAGLTATGEPHTFGSSAPTAASALQPALPPYSLL